MKKQNGFYNLILTALSLIFLMSGTALCSGQQSEDYLIETDVLSSGGMTVTSADYSITGTIGQPSIIGNSSSTDYVVGHGFWPRLDQPCLNHGDVNGNGSLSAEDAQIAFYIVLGSYTPTPTELCAADCNGSGTITAADAQSIFFSLFGPDLCEDAIPAFFDSEDTPGMIRQESDLVVLESNWEEELWFETTVDLDTGDLLVDVSIFNPETPVDAFTIDLFYNSEDWKFIGCNEGALFTDWFEFQCSEIEPGHIVIAAYTVDDEIFPDNSGNLFSLRFGMLWNESAETGFKFTLSDDLKDFVVLQD